MNEEKLSGWHHADYLGGWTSCPTFVRHLSLVEEFVGKVYLQYSGSCSQSCPDLSLTDFKSTFSLNITITYIVSSTQERRRIILHTHHTNSATNTTLLIVWSRVFGSSESGEVA